MTIIHVACKSILLTSPTTGGHGITLELNMSSEQMKNALADILDCATEAEVAEWVRELAPEVIAEERRQAGEVVRAVTEAMR